MANLNDMSIVCGKSELPWVLWYIVTSGKIGFYPNCVGRGGQETVKYYCPDCTLVVQ